MSDTDRCLTRAYWRVVFDYPPFNIVDASIFEALQDLRTQIQIGSTAVSRWMARASSRPARICRRRICRTRTGPSAAVHILWKQLSRAFLLPETCAAAM